MSSATTPAFARLTYGDLFADTSEASPVSAHGAAAGFACSDQDAVIATWLRSTRRDRKFVPARRRSAPGPDIAA